MSPDPTSPDEKLFNVALETRNFEISLFWQRSNYFLVLTTALAVGFFSLGEKPYAVLLASLGAVVAALWFLVNLGSKYWQSRWEHELTVRERRLYPNDPLFATNRSQTDQYVRESLRYHNHGWLNSVVDPLVLLKPSVSLMMMALSLVFFFTWVSLLIGRYHLLYSLAWIKLQRTTLTEFTISVLSSLAAIAVLYVLYLASAAYARRHVAKAECWWLPDANTFRFVIRNIPRKGNLSGIRYRAWLRKDVPASQGLSVRTYLDEDLVQGERFLLPGRQDLPVICFRFEAVGQVLNLVVTDKMGHPEDSLVIDDQTQLMVEFSVRARTWLLFKHEISRLYIIPQHRTLEGQGHNIFLEILLPMQNSNEREMKSVLQYAEEVTVTV